MTQATMTLRDFRIRCGQCRFRRALSLGHIAREVGTTAAALQAFEAATGDLPAEVVRALAKRWALEVPAGIPAASEGDADRAMAPGMGRPRP